MRRQDLALLALYFGGFTKIRNLILRRRGLRLVRFVTYHDIPASASGDFAAMMRYLQRVTNVVSMDDFFAGRLSDQKTNVVITFDDGYQSWKTIAVPLLKTLGLPSTFFFASNLLGRPRAVESKSNATRCSSDRGSSGWLTEADVSEMALDGFTIGGHTANHVNLGLIRDQAVLAREITADKQRLESITGREVRYFAYPFGVYRNGAVDLVGLLRAAGYRGAVTVVPGLNLPTTDPYLLHRELTGVPMSLPVFAARVDGAHDGVRFVKARLRSLLRGGAAEE